MTINVIQEEPTQAVPIPIPTTTRMGELRPSDPRFVQPVWAVDHLANQFLHGPVQ